MIILSWGLFFPIKKTKYFEGLTLAEVEEIERVVGEVF